MVYAEELPSLEAAPRRERQLKRWTRAKKEALIAGDAARLHLLAKCAVSQALSRDRLQPRLRAAALHG
jgi:predicted GIY-YIG superfamily endonuclease